MISKRSGIRVLSTLLIVFLLSFSLNIFAGDGSNIYWVSNTGIATWSDSESSTPLSGTSCCALSTANNNASAGDIVYLRAGTYSSAFDNISPANSGTSWSNQITFSAYNNEIVIISTQICPNRHHETSAWIAVNGATVSHSSVQAWEGTYSTKFTVGVANEGIKSNIFPMGAARYTYSAWIYSPTRTSVNIYIRKGDDSGTAVDKEHAIYSSKWCYINGNFNGSAGSNAYIAFGSPTGVSSGDWYIDNVRIHAFKPGISLNGDDYIKVQGINFDAVMRGFVIENGADYNEISNCTFNDLQAEVYYTMNIIWNGGGSASTYNWIHDCTFSFNGFVYQTTGSNCNDQGTTFRIGNTSSDDSRYNLIENCAFYYGGHDLLLISTKYNTIRNNIFHNEGWRFDHYSDCYEVNSSPNAPTDGFGNRCIILENPADNSGWNLFENNRIGYAGTPPDDDGSFGLENPTDCNIIRYNFMYGNGGSGMYFKPHYGYPENNRFYNNTVYNNGGGEDIHTIFQAGISYGNNNISGNVIKNNIVYNNITADIKSPPGNTNINNWLTTNGDPLFVNPDMSDKTNLILPDLSLQPGSGAINQGMALTTVDNSDIGSGISLIVVDAIYFQDGRWTPPGKIDADWIAVGTVGNVAQISSINYSTNTITLTSVISRNDGDSVWLYKDSSGNIVLIGSAPDIGASEYGIDPPKDLKVLSEEP